MFPDTETSHYHKLCKRVSLYLYLCPDLFLFVFLMTGFLTRMRWNPKGILVCISLMANEAEHVLMCSLTICIYLLRTVRCFHHLMIPLIDRIVCFHMKDVIGILMRMTLDLKIAFVLSPLDTGGLCILWCLLQCFFSVLNFYSIEYFIATKIK